MDAHSDANDPFILGEVHAVRRTWRQGLPPEQVLRSFELLTALGPRVAETHSGAGEALLTLGRAKASLGCHQLAVRQRPADAPLRVRRAAALLALRRPREALADLRVAVALDPVRPGTLRRMAGCLAQLGRRPEARAAEREERALIAEIAAARRGPLGPRLSERTRWVLSGGPGSVARSVDDPRAWWRAASLLELLGRADAATACAGAARELRDEPASWLSRAELLRRLPALAEAPPGAVMVEAGGASR